MSDSTKNNQTNPEASDKPELCKLCKQFFGTKATDYLCSKCFKSAQPIKTKTLSATVKPAEEVIQDIQPTLTVVEEKPAEDNKKEQHDSKKCMICPKKVGSLGWKCKCGSTYCKNHRLPEDHACIYDFKEEGAKKLKKENPIVVASKLVRI